MLDPEMTVKNSVTIAIDGTESTVLKKQHYKFIAIFLPGDWITGTITFKGSDTENGTFLSVVHADDVGAVTIPSVAASKCIVLNGEILEALLAVPFIKLVAGAAQTTTSKKIIIIMSR